MESLFGPTDDVERNMELLHATTVINRFKKPVPWPADPAKDRALVTQIMRDFPSFNWERELGKFSAWLLDMKTDKREIRYRVRLNEWASRSCRYSQRPAGSERARSHRPVVAPIQQLEHSGPRSWQ